MFMPPPPLGPLEAAKIMSKLIDISSARGSSELLRAESAHSEAGADLANMLAAFSSKIFESCAAIGQDGCNTYVTVAEANILQNAALELRRGARQSSGSRNE